MTRWPWFCVAGVSLYLVAGAPVHGQIYHLYLRCEGEFIADGRSRPADAEFALRDNDMTALIQSSSVLPIGETVPYQASERAYTIRYRMPGAGSRIFQHWLTGEIVEIYPHLRSLTSVRLSIDRHTGKLDGALRDQRGEVLGTMAMTCSAVPFDEMPKPKF
ncbi:MAG: hypothetical protein R3E87_22325 [Burkholderiaceae bacterium]